MSKDTLEQADVHVQVKTPDQTTTTCKPVIISQPGQLQALYKPLVTGSYIVTASLQGKQLPGSPATVKVVKSPGFDPARCHADLKLTNDMRTVTHSSHRGYRSVCGVELFTSGQVSVDMRLDVLPSKPTEIFICACMSPQPRLDGYHCNEQEIFGWYGRCAGNYWYGKDLGQPWKPADVITLTLDLDKHTLTGHHHRTGKTSVLNISTGHFYWYVSLWQNGQQVSIV